MIFFAHVLFFSYFCAKLLNTIIMKRIFTLSFMCLMTVLSAMASPLQGISLNTKDTAILVGEPLQLQLAFTPADAEYSYVRFLSNSNNIVVDDYGNVTAIGAEKKATIVVTVGKAAGDIDPTADPKITSFSDTCTVTSIYRMEDGCGDFLYFTIDYNYVLEFWAEAIGKNKTAVEPKIYTMKDYGTPDNPGNNGVAPWYGYDITGINLYNVNVVGNNAFRDMSKLGYITIYEGTTLRDSVFMGSTNLTTIEVRDTAVATITRNSLITDKANNKQVKVVVVQDDALRARYENDPFWNANGRVFVAQTGSFSGDDAAWNLTQSDSLGSLQLQVWQQNTTKDSILIPDMDTTSIRPPWHELRDAVEDLVIGDRIAYIGKNAFASLKNLQTIQFHQYAYSLDSIHVDAFDHNITPWKFAMGDPQDGAIVPPTIVGASEAAGFPTNFSQQTVLYVPDTTFEYEGQLVKAIDLYKQAPFWKDFKRITDRTVASQAEDESVLLTWLPLENAEGYRLTIHKVGCEKCDTSVIIPALGGKGLIDWANNTLPIYIVPSAVATRRKPMGDDGDGGMTIVIQIGAGSGSAPHDDVAISASKLDAKSDYTFTREVLLSGGKTNAAYTKTGQFQTKEKMPSSVEVVDEILQTPAIYDLMGRYVGERLEYLPNGMYILVNGRIRTTILLQR